MRCFLVSKRRVVPSRLVCFAASVLATVASLAAPGHAGIITFGSGSNQFNMEFVTIGNPGNLADTSGTPNPAGAVGYTYAIGKFEVSEDMITKYNANFGTANNLVITKDTFGVNKPATSVSWNEAARFVNWLNTSTGNQAAYKFTTGGVNDNIAFWTSGDAGYGASNPYRNSLAKYFLPSYNEWCKAAFYNPTNSTWYDYANGSNTAPTLVASGTTADTAVYNQPVPQGPADVDKAGGLSPYGVMGLGATFLNGKRLRLTSLMEAFLRLGGAAAAIGSPAPASRHRCLAAATSLTSCPPAWAFVSQVCLHPRRSLSRIRRRSSDSLHLAWLTALDATAETRRS
jgi:hypothetical protein